MSQDELDRLEVLEMLRIRALRHSNEISATLIDLNFRRPHDRELKNLKRYLERNRNALELMLLHIESDPVRTDDDQNTTTE